MLLRDFMVEFGARAFGLNPGALWGVYHGLRDRKELREGGFQKVYAGPGGGVRVTPFIVSHLLAGALAGSTRGDAADAAWRVWHLTAPPPITDNALFGGVLNDILADPKLAATVREVQLYRTPTCEAVINWRGKRDASSFFEDADATERARCDGAFRTAATIGGATLLAVAQTLAAAAINSGQPAGRSGRAASRAVEKRDTPREPAVPPKPWVWPLAR